MKREKDGKHKRKAQEISSGGSSRMELFVGNGSAKKNLSATVKMMEIAEEEEKQKNSFQTMSSRKFVVSNSAQTIQKAQQTYSIQKRQTKNSKTQKQLQFETNSDFGEDIEEESEEPIESNKINPHLEVRI